MKRTLLLALVPAALLAAGAALAQPPKYSLTKIPDPSWQHSSSIPISMGNDGSVAMSNGGALASYWRPDIGTVLVEFPSQDYTYFELGGNSNGMVVGGYQRSGFGPRAGVWEFGKGGRVLWDRQSVAAAVNDRNEILAQDYDGASYYVYADGSYREIKSPPNSSSPMGIRRMSDSGYAAGTAFINRRQTDWVSRPGGDAEAIGFPPGYQFADVFALGEDGTAYGNAFSQRDGSSPGFIRTIDGAWTLVRNTLYGNGDAFLLFSDVNRSSLIVGRAYVGMRNGRIVDHTILYSKELGLLDLNSLLDASGAGWELVGSAYINDLGQISTIAFDASRKPYAVVLNPVPEPASLLILTAGLGLLVRKRRVRT